MAFNFNKYEQDFNAIINHISEKLKTHDEQSERMLRGALHTLRDIISLEESIDFMAQFPMFIKAVYVDGWSGKVHSDIDTRAQFVARLKENEASAHRDFADDDTAIIQQCKVIYAALDKYISAGAAKDVVANLPKELKDLFEFID